MNKTTRTKLLALIHTQKRAANLDDEAYISILIECAQVDSASHIQTQAKFSAVISAMNAVLRKQGKEPMGRQNEWTSAFTWSTKKRAERILGSMNRLSGFLAKMNKERIEDCTDQELRRINGFLSTIERNGASNAKG